jgi:DNA mismatch repair protein MutS
MSSQAPKYTPMIEQYLSIKAEVPDAFLLFRLGDFYELFFEDAINASRELEITLTGREGGLEERIPMCGVPYHSAENYITRLIERGYKVAICEQVEDPSQAKGVVRREIVRIVTPGTVMDGKTLGEGRNNYISCVAAGEDEFGLAICDLTTGELYVTQTAGAPETVADELAVYQPAELIGPLSSLTQISSSAKQVLPAVVISDWEKRGDDAMERQFPKQELERLSAVGRLALSLLIAYLNETQKRSLTHISTIRNYEHNQSMIMDPFTRRNLELVETVRERSKKGSLLWLLDKTVTSMGARLLRRWIDKPLMSKSRIEERLEAVDRLYNQLIVREELRQNLREIYDLERLVARVSYGNANARDLIALKASLARVPAIQELALESRSTTLERLVSDLDACSDVMSWIEAAIVDEPPVSVREGGMIRTGYHAYLDQLHEASKNGKQWIAELERIEKETTGIKSLKVGFNKVFGYYIEVTRSNLSSIPEGRYERKQTLANAERFITPELKEKEALILEAEEKMSGLEYELFAELRDRIAGQLQRLQALAGTIAALDAYQSLATVSAANRYRRPDIHEGYELMIREGRHPVVEAVMKDGSFVANETDISVDEGRVLLITGPNMAGKSTYMRQVATICIMAQIGCFVPAEEARIPIIDRIFTRIGAADDLVGGQSTFMVEMMDIQTMTSKATRRSLVIIDELGRGTSTGEGMAIAQSVIEHLYHQIGCKTLVSTHFHELAHLEETLSGLRNHCMSVKESGREVTFLRKLIRGAASTSYGIYCARIAGLPEPIIDRAYELLHAFEERVKGYDEASLAESNAAAGRLSTGEEGQVLQLSMFELPGQAPERARSKPARTDRVDRQEQDHPLQAIDPKQEEIVRRLREADLINMTPLQAMNLLYELKQKTQG